MKHRGCALFFAVMFGCIALFIIHVVRLRSAPDDPLVLGGVILVVVLIAARFMYAAVTGRIPPWMQELIDDPD